MTRPRPEPCLLSDPWFSTLGDAEREVLLGAAHERKLPAGAFLFRRGEAIADTGCGFCVLTSGRLKIATLAPGGDEYIFGFYSPGLWFGDESAIRRRTHLHDASACEPTSLLVIPQATFRRLLVESPTLALAVTELLAKRVEFLFKRLENTVGLSVRERVAAHLYGMVRNTFKPRLSTSDTLPVSQYQLAMMIGISRPTLSKELRFLAREKIVSIHYSRIHVLDVARLREVAGLTGSGSTRGRAAARGEL